MMLVLATDAVKRLERSSDAHPFALPLAEVLGAPVGGGPTGAGQVSVTPPSRGPLQSRSTA